VIDFDKLYCFHECPRCVNRQIIAVAPRKRLWRCGPFGSLVEAEKKSTTHYGDE